MAEVVTGEAVVLDLTVARFPSRMVALLLDGVVQIVALILLDGVIFSHLTKQLNDASRAAVYVAGYVIIFVGYPVIFETLSRGKTLGKLALGLRVVSDDGGPVRFRQALIRGLFAAFLELWPLPFIALLASMISMRGKRLGDQVAGTFVIQERVPAPRSLSPAMTAVPPFLLGWAPSLELSRLSDHNAAAAASYLRRYYELGPAARDTLGNQIAAAIAAQVSPAPPPGTPAAAYLSAVLAVRRDREHARLAAMGGLQGGYQPPAPPGGYAPGGYPPPPPPPGPFTPVPTAAATPGAAPADPPAVTTTAEDARPTPPPADLGFVAPN